MVDPDRPGEDSSIPAAYTYFGQFVDHDITFEVQPADLPECASGAMSKLLDAGMTPLPAAEIRNALRNFRTPTLDLDSVYGPPAPRDPAHGAKLRPGTNTELNSPQPPLRRPPGKGTDNDLLREGRNQGNTLHDRAALIGDPGNDENTIISQLHVAFLEAHNALVDAGLSFDEARRTLRRHYQHIVVHDFHALEAGGFVTRTPLWFYLLAEAAHHHGGDRLGPVGSTIVAEVLVGLFRRSEDSILKLPGWTPSLPAAEPGTFELADLLRFAGVLGDAEAPRTYPVRRGDTLSSIAQAELGDRNRWPEIFERNRDIISNPDRIIPGQVLVLPA